MKKILVIGAGKSATVLIDYLLEHAPVEHWQIVVADVNEADAARKISGEHAVALGLDITHQDARKQAISNADLVVSMLPAYMHLEVAKDCVTLGKHLVTASYVSDEMLALHDAAEKAGVILLNEMGLDPGIDHMSAMRVLDMLRDANKQIVEFETFTGGLLAPESENNPWKYKFTWNPRNVVMAASGGAVKFLHGGTYKYIPYHKVFRRTEVITLDGLGEFEGYANRDSLKYLNIYKLQGVKTLYRGTLRRVGFCRAWDIFVQLGATDDSYVIEGSESMTHRQFINSFLLYSPTDSVELKLAYAMRLDLDSDEMRKLTWLGIFDETPIGYGKPGTPAQLLQHILEKKWTLAPDDKDMIVMWHRFAYMEGDVRKEMYSTMAVKGDDGVRTAMAKTVGLPVGIAVKMILNGQITQRGVQIPVIPEIYNPVLNDLEGYGIQCVETNAE